MAQYSTHAWESFGGSNDGKGTLIRTGVGIFSDLAPAFIVSNVFTNPPFPYGATVTSGQVGLAASDPLKRSGLCDRAVQHLQERLRRRRHRGAVAGRLSPIPFNGFHYYSVPNHFGTPLYAEWSFEIEQPIGQKNVFVATYSGNGQSEVQAATWCAGVQPDEPPALCNTEGQSVLRRARLITSTAIPPTSAYGAFQGSAVSGRVLVVTGRFNF